jgi:hypothetical protein
MGPFGLSRDSSGSDELSSFVSWFIGFQALRIQYSLICMDGASRSKCDLPDGTPYYLVDGYRRFGGTCYLHLYDGNMWGEGSVVLYTHPARKEMTLTCRRWSLTRASMNNEQEGGCSEDTVVLSPTRRSSKCDIIRLFLWSLRI